MPFKQINQKVMELENLPEIEVSGKIPSRDQLCQFWPIIKIALLLAKIFTGPKGDTKIDAVIAWGNELCHN